MLVERLRELLPLDVEVQPASMAEVEAQLGYRANGFTSYNPLRVVVATDSNNINGGVDSTVIHELGHVYYWLNRTWPWSPIAAVETEVFASACEYLPAAQPGELDDLVQLGKELFEYRLPYYNSRVQQWARVYQTDERHIRCLMQQLLIDLELI